MTTKTDIGTAHAKRKQFGDGRPRWLAKAPTPACSGASAGLWGALGKQERSTRRPSDAGLGTTQ